jgi:hypothetical protein
MTLNAQGPPAPRPVAPTGIVTDPGFAGALGNSVQGTLNMRPGWSYGGPIIGGFAPWTGFYQGPAYYVPPPQPPTMVEQVNAPAVVVQPPPVFVPPVPEAPVVSVYSYPAHQQAEDPAPNPTPSPRVADQNAAALHALSQSMEAANALANGHAANDSRPANDSLVLIALKDQNVVTAIAYWTDRGELKYVTPARQQKQVPLSQVDVKLSERLNNERHVPFHLESAPRWEPAPQY